MAEFNWKKANSFDKMIFCLGWLNVLNLLFWIIIIIVGNLNYEEKFWNNRTYYVVYVFGWIVFAILLFGIIVTIFDSI